jgi:sugar-specific transcriptional regulator TrmB
MTDTDLGAQLTPEETSYFESGGATEIPADSSGGDDAAAAAATEGGDEGLVKPESRPEKMVSLAALHEERSRRKEIDRQNRELQQQVAEMRGKFAVIDRLTAPPEPPQPTVENDIFGVVKNTTSAVNDIRRRLDAADRQKHEEAARDDLVRAYQIDAAQFEAKAPDFKAAYNHLLASRAQELIALGYDSPQAIHEALLADEFAVAQMGLASRRSPAEIIYGLAQQRGYRKAGGNGAERLNTLERGRESHKSLSSTGGGSGDAEMSAEALLKMPMDEFEAWCSKNPARAKRIMGG